MGCYNCCMRCLGGIPYTSLVATLMCFSGVALFCGCGHQALTETERLIEYYFARNLQDYVTLAYIIQYFQYIIYALASFFFLYCILLLAEGFYTTSAAKQTFGEFRSTVCGRCLGITFIAVTYALAVLWLAVYAFSALPVFFFYNMAATCHTIDELSDSTSNINQLCIDARQYGLLPWNVMPGKVCGMTLLNTCKTKEFQLTYDLFIAAFAGAGITLLALLTYVMSTTYNFAVLRYLGRKGIGYLVIWNARIQADGNEWSVGCELAIQCVTLLYGFLHLATMRLYLRERRRKHKAEFVDLFGTPVMDWKRGISSPYGAPDQEL